MKPHFLFPLLALLFFAGRASGAECNPPVEFPKNGFMDQDCRLGRRIKRDGIWWLERLDAKDLHVKSREAVDCSKAVYSPDGQYYYWPKSFNAYIWCPAYENPDIAAKLAMRKHGDKPDEKEKSAKEEKHGDGDQH